MSIFHRYALRPPKSTARVKPNAIITPYHFTVIGEDKNGSEISQKTDETLKVF